MYFPGTRFYKGAWKETVDAAEAYNDPGRFTALSASNGPPWARGTTSTATSSSATTETRPCRSSPTLCPALRRHRPGRPLEWMDDYEKKTGGSVLAIAHNGNLSNGEMFPIVEAFGKAVDREYAETRAKWERLYEVTQTKGDGETHPFLSPNDEFADYELWDKGNLDGSEAKTNEMLAGEYARSALKNGLKLEEKLGTNPYKFGLVGSSDAHTGLTAMEEDNFFGKTTPQEPSPHRMSATFVNNAKTGVKIMDWEVCSAGYAAVWANENTRESIWDAMQRKETYATTGSRMIVRFFGGWEFEKADADTRNPANTGYTKGVPMGGDLQGAPEGKSPTFLVAAMKDPLGRISTASR